MKVYILLLLAAIVVTGLLTPVVRWATLRFGIVPEVRDRDVQKKPMPRLGGIAMTAAFIVVMLIAWRIPFMAGLFQNSSLWAVLIAAAAMCVLGVVDDILELDWMTKLAGQFLISGFMAYMGVQLVSFPIFGLTIGSSRLSLIVTVLVVTGIVNAVNFIDGLDGLAAGMVAIGAITFFGYSYMLTRLMDASSYATGAALIVIILAGVCMGFLWFNWHPASIIMGGGAETIGLILAAAGIIVTGQIDPMVLPQKSVFAGLLPILLPLAVVAIPLINIVITPMRRILNHTSPFAADRTHLHDRLLSRGHSHMGTVFILYVWTAIICVAAVSLLFFPVHRVLLVLVPIAVFQLLVTANVYPLTPSSRRARRVERNGTPEQDSAPVALVNQQKTQPAAIPPRASKSRIPKLPAQRPSGKPTWDEIVGNGNEEER